MKRLLCSALLLFAICIPSLAPAAEPAAVTIEWQWPTLNCDGSSIAVEEIDQAEVYIDDAPIPSASEADGDPCSSPVDVPPELAQVQSVTTPETSVTVDLPRGATYFIRMRVQVNGVWSNLSAQAEREVGFSQPQIPIIVHIG